jgi:hypothetical protein
MRRVPLVLVVIAALAGALSGCASTGVTADRLNESVGATFGRLYRWSLELQGQPSGKPLDSQARCYRGSPSINNPNVPSQGPVSYVGAGDNWTCTVLYNINGANSQVSFNWNVSVKADGCWAADGIPPQLGGQTIETPTGKTLIDPIYLADGCFSAT